MLKDREESNLGPTKFLCLVLAPILFEVGQAAYNVVLSLNLLLGFNPGNNLTDAALEQVDIENQVLLIAVVTSVIAAIAVVALVPLQKLTVACAGAASILLLALATLADQTSEILLLSRLLLPVEGTGGFTGVATSCDGKDVLVEDYILALFLVLAVTATGFKFARMIEEARHAEPASMAEMFVSTGLKGAGAGVPMLVVVQVLPLTYAFVLRASLDAFQVALVYLFPVVTSFAILLACVGSFVVVKKRSGGNPITVVAANLEFLGTALLLLYAACSAILAYSGIIDGSRFCNKENAFLVTTLAFLGCSIGFLIGGLYNRMNPSG